MGIAITAVTGAKKNAGDFLIVEKSLEMLRYGFNPEEVYEIRREEDVYPHIDRINETDAIFLCGGPSYRANMYPSVYPFLKYMDDFEPPIVPMGLGWEGVPLFTPRAFRFNTDTLKVIKRIHRNIPNSTTRDEITRGLLFRFGINNVINTGCPSLFDLHKLREHLPFRLPGNLESIAISMAQNPVLHEQNLRLIAGLQKMAPNAEFTAVFHRGISAGKYASELEGKRLEHTVDRVRDQGIRIIDASYGTQELSVYNDVDFHVGYRVHAHAYCVSQRVPSFLLWEDGRGQGMSLNLGIKGIAARKRRILDLLPLPNKIRRGYGHLERRVKLIGRQSVRPEAEREMLKMIQNQALKGYPMFTHIPDRLDQLFQRMKKFLKVTREYLEISPEISQSQMRS